ncbi:hypothetical protein AN219_11235, partial [Streptomyces nanshensis]
GGPGGSGNGPGGGTGTGGDRVLHAAGQYVPRELRDTARAHRDSRHDATEPGKPESDAWAPRLPGQRGRG